MVQQPVENSMAHNVGLPLLIVKGTFKDLDLMSIRDLETFIPFLAKCSIFRAGAQLVNNVPAWWIPNVPFKFPLKKPESLTRANYRHRLSDVVQRCYEYHNAHFLVDFCAKVAKSPHLVALKANDDDTTSIIYKGSLHILTFNNENKNYDLDNQEPNEEQVSRRTAPRRCLLQQNQGAATQPLTVYLCENCDREFSSCKDMEQHERVCCPGGPEVVPETSQPREQSPTTSYTPHRLDQGVFLELFGLTRKGSTPRKRPVTSGVDSPSKRWVSADVCLHKNGEVEFSSLYGRRMLKLGGSRRGVVVGNPEKMVQSYEFYCHTSTRPYSRYKRHSVLTQRQRQLPHLQDKMWTHSYSFSKRERLARHKTLKTGLDRSSRQLLKQCKPCSVPLERVCPERFQVQQKTLVEEVTPPPLQQTEVIDLCSTDDEG